ncbi:tripartite tricarboxylate transporter TctB family protein [Paracoccus sediminis]|uniref:Putative tricarboxylic transport membrane protein n=1 Tax=Paracoccus sediminis TaxID=1214787 RepID=A0A238WLY2_9RHOB|nr:tripartite tricarboxylate transporter TctB family protein [Paracoccus sediminis]TBN50494.1 tripartite tricarboxylate transporter TctB family protein [Paracoccus sediminis]SNR47381.1 putative tricarboxylic transport membrane protein [Paracoccus sediminis]
MNGTTPETRRPDGATLVAAAILAAIAIVIWRDAARLPQAGGYAGVGPADVPRWIAIGLGGLALWSLVEAFRSGKTGREPQNVGPILWIIGGLAAQLALLTTAGFSIATGLLFAATAHAFGKRNLVLTVPVGIVFALVVYLIFAGLLKLSLPAGPLEGLIWGLFRGTPA